MRVWTVGHSDHTLDAFLALLRAYGILLVADVRAFPRSRHVPWFDEAVLSASLSAEGIAYRHFPGLGGRRRARADSPNGGWRNASFRGYADHMATPEFAEALARLIECAERTPTAIMCAEAVPWRCHRSLIADALVASGAEVWEILSPTQARPHAITPFAVVRGRDITYPPPAEQR